MGVELVGGDCPSLASTASISVSLLMKASLSAASICWKARLASLFCVARNRPYEVTAISMGAFVSATIPASSASVHGARMLA